MDNSKLVTVLKTLNKYDLAKIEKMFLSPYFTEDQDLVVIFRALIPFHPYYEDPSLERKVFFKKVFKNKKVTENNFNGKLTRMLECVNEHIFSHTFYKQKVKLFSYSVLGNYYIDHLLPKQVEDVLKDYEKAFQDFPTRSEDYFLLRRQYYAIISGNNVSQQNLTEIGPSCESILYLDKHYVYVKLKYITSFKTMQYFINIKPTIHFEEDIIRWIETSDHLMQEDSIYLWYRMLKFLYIENPSREEMMTYIDELAKRRDAFDKVELSDIFSNLQNYCIKVYNSHNPDFMHVLNHMYRLFYRNNWIGSESNYFPPSFMTNMMTVSLRVEDVENAEWLLKDVAAKKNIDKTKFQDTYTLLEVQLLLYKKEYDKVLKKINLLRLKDIGLEIELRKNLVKTLYEDKEYDMLSMQLKNFQSLINRNEEIGDFRFQNNVNFIKILQKLMLEKELDSLMEELQNTDPVSEKKWLEKQVKSAAQFLQ